MTFYDPFFIFIPETAKLISIRFCTDESTLNRVEGI
jgi:hypothetical protein